MYQSFPSFGDVVTGNRRSTNGQPMTGVKPSIRSEKGIRKKSQGSNAARSIPAAYQCYGNPAISRNPLYKNQILTEVAERQKAVCLSFWAAQSNAWFYNVPQSSERREEKAKREKETCTTTDRWGTTFHLDRARPVYDNACPCGYNRVETWAFWSTAISSSTKIVIKHFVLFLTDNPGAFTWSSNIMWGAIRVLFLLSLFFSHFSCAWISCKWFWVFWRFSLGFSL